MHVQAGLSVDPLDDHRPLARHGVERVDVGTAPADHQVHHQPASVVADRHIGPGLGRGQPIEHDGVVGVRCAQTVEANVAVVLVALGVDGVPEPTAVRQPGNAGGTGVRDALGEHLAGVGAHHVQHRLLGAAFAQSVGDQATVGRRVEPVDGDRTVDGQRCRVEQRPSRFGGVGRAPHHQRVLVGASSALDDEQLLAGDLRIEHRGQRHERGKALVPSAPCGPGIERLSRS